MELPKIKVFINRGSVEAIYADTCLLDIEVIECREASYLKHFDKYYEAAENAGLEEIGAKTTVVCTPWYGDDEEENDVRRMEQG